MDKENGLINKICELADQNFWHEIKLKLSFTESGGYGMKATFLNEKNNKLENLSIPLRVLRPYIKHLIDRQRKLKDSEKKFNTILISLNKNLQLSIEYEYNLQNVETEKLNQSRVFYQWLNETMMNRIYDFEKEKKLLTPVYDDDGELDFYESSWDEGEFEFKILDNKVLHKITLVKNRISRRLKMSLPDYLINAILEHHKITNQELTEEWSFWNKLIIKSPHNSIPYDRESEFVTYSLEQDI